METADREVLRTAVEWLAAGETVYLATVAKTFGSSPRPPGSLVALRADGRFVGSVSGGCMEEDLVARLRGGRLPEKFPAVVTYGVTQEEAQRFGLPCGGKLELVLERTESAASLKSILEQIDKRRARLATLGVSRENLARLHGPVGLPIGSKTPAEIAVAVLAGVTAARHGIALEARPQIAPALLQVSR